MKAYLSPQNIEQSKAERRLSGYGGVRYEGSDTRNSQTQGEETPLKGQRSTRKTGDLAEGGSERAENGVCHEQDNQEVVGRSHKENRRDGQKREGGQDTRGNGGLEPRSVSGKRTGEGELHGGDIEAANSDIEAQKQQRSPMTPMIHSPSIE